MYSNSCYECNKAVVSKPYRLVLDSPVKNEDRMKTVAINNNVCFERAKFIKRIHY